MTLEEKAVKHSLQYDVPYSEEATLEDMLSRPQDFTIETILGVVKVLRQKSYKDGYINGAKENGVVWHDLRKNPKDLPPVYKTVLDDEGFECFYVKVAVKKDVFVEKWKYYDINGDEWEQKPPIAWCERPQFKE